MKQLTLEHLAPYLPYDVKVIFIEDVYYGGFNKESYKDKIGDFAYKKTRKGKIHGYKNGHALSTIGKFYIDKMNDKFIGPHVTHHYTKKLILRPLSDLITVPEHIIKMEYRSISRNGGECFTLKQYKYLFANHFDVFGLIDAGLAIDINTLPDAT